MKRRRPTAGKRVRVRFALTDPANVALSIERLGKRGGSAETEVANRDAPAGVGEISWNGKLDGRKAKPGTYRLSVTASAEDTSAASSIQAKLVRRKKR